MQKHQTHFPTDKAQLLNNATIFIAAGTETTSTHLCGTIFYLLSHPSIYSRLGHEIRSAATSISDLNLETIHKMPYLKACMLESLRIYPPVPGTLTRVVPKVGAVICGKYVPRNTVVGVNQWATYHNSKNFRYQDSFHPARWLDVGNEEFAGDRRNALQPFSYGPRKCIANE